MTFQRDGFASKESLGEPGGVSPRIFYLLNP